MAARMAKLQTLDMDNSKNGGPNFLRNWRDYRKLTQEDLAAEVGTTAGMISMLENGERQLSAKWLRRLAPALGTTPGWLLDHDPYELPHDLFDLWQSARPEQREQITALAETVVSFRPSAAK
jgi:transcriptional regulator with XRE-family HTH domain